MLDIVKNLIDEYVDQLPETSRRNAYGFPCYFVKDRVFGLYDGIALVLRLDKPAGDELLVQRVAKRFRHARNASGRTWIRINPEKLQSEEVLETLIIQSYNFVREDAS